MDISTFVALLPPNWPEYLTVIEVIDAPSYYGRDRGPWLATKLGYLMQDRRYFMEGSGLNISADQWAKFGAYPKPSSSVTNPVAPVPPAKCVEYNKPRAGSKTASQPSGLDDMWPAMPSWEAA